MMKKNGFTLAEVLITLAIIGVVATLTLPALLQNTQEQQAKTALKKGINTLTELVGMNAAVSGFDYASISSDDTESRDAEAEQSLFAMMANRASVDFAKSSTGGDEGGYTEKNLQFAPSGMSSNYAVFFRDGSVLWYLPTDTLGNAASGGGNKVSDMMDDGLPYGIRVVLDTNGVKGPNVLSNCEGNGTGADSDTQDIAECNDAGKRVIKDMFGIRLRGSYAVPNGAAARWAFEN
ncbi:MAG: type II secretion system GspH family protein [Muribaculaceae bacterium]|nr:type II secretion system GspH family protein [Muribaculaceae bacterium]